MYEPESSVPRPLMPAVPMRGLTTQKWVSATAMLAALRSMRTPTSTRLRSSLSDTDSTRPTTTSLKRTSVLPDSRPSAVRNSMTMCGPASRQVRTRSDAPMFTARIGTIHTSDSRVGFFFVITGSGRACGNGSPGGLGGSPGGAGSAGSLIGVLGPDQARVEAAGGEHRHDHDRGESEQPRFGLDLREVAEAHHAGQQHDDVDVEHRPVPHRLDDAEQPCPLGPAPARPAACAPSEQAERADL